MDLLSLKPRFTPFWWLHADTRMIEVFSAIAALLFALLLLLPYSLFEIFPAYTAMGMILPEWAWGVGYALLWLSQSYAMCGNVYVARLPSAFLAFVMWGLAAGAFFWANPLGFAPYIHGLLSLFMAWVVIKGPTDGDY